jgi:STE24 endopeptidase
VAAPLAALILWSMDAAGSLRWPVAWVLWTAFVVVRTWAYPSLVAPLFNRVAPLPDDGLRKRIAALLERCGLRLG